MTPDLQFGATPVEDLLRAIDEIADAMIVTAIGVESGGNAIRSMVREAARTLAAREAATPEGAE